MSRATILIVEDQELVRSGIASLLMSERDLEVVGQASTVAEGIQMAAQLKPDITLLDFSFKKGEPGSEFLPSARGLGYMGKVLVVSASLSDPEALHLLRQGVSGIFLKDGSPEMLANAIRMVAQGEVWLNRHHFELLLRERSSGKQDEFTEREARVLRHVFEGLSNKEISVALGLSEPAVKAVVQQIFRKTGVRTRGQLVRFAMERHSYLLGQR